MSGHPLDDLAHAMVCLEAGDPVTMGDRYALPAMARGDAAVGPAPAAWLLDGDCLEVTRAMPESCVDLVVGSPPYGNARTYGPLGFALTGAAWADWAVERFREQCRVSKGLVCWVVDGNVTGGAWDPLPALLIAGLHAAGVCVRRPLVYKRFGQPGSGGRQYFRWDHEWVVVGSAEPGRLPWADNTADGHAPKHPVGGAVSARHRDGTRRNTKTGARLKRYRQPEKVNPGSVIDCGAVGGGNIGDPEAHENEAPFPEMLASRLVRSFCPPGGIVLDPFSGSGTTARVALACGRHAVGVDVRADQRTLAGRRLVQRLGAEAAGELGGCSV